MNKEKSSIEPIKKSKVPMRQVIIETDGNNINIIKAEVAGNLELIAILQSILQRISAKQLT